MKFRTPFAARRGDDGFTLIELLVTISIISIIALPLAQAFMVSVRHNTTTTERVDRSHDAQLLANYIVEDAQSADGPGVSTSDVTTCTPPAGAAPVLRLQWAAADGATHRINYVKVGDTVTRLTCGGAGSGSNVVGHNVASVAVSCTPGACASSSTGLRVEVTETAGDTAQPYAFALDATFRKSTGAEPAGAPQLPIMFLGSTNNCMELSSSGSIQVPAGAALAGNCSGYFGSSGNFGGAPTYSVGGCSPSSSSVCGNWTSGMAQFDDPYASLTVPTAHQVGASCPTATTRQPGTFNSDVTWGGTVKEVLGSGIYVFTKKLELKDKAVTSCGPVLLVFTGSGTGDFIVGGKGSLLIDPWTSGNFAGFSIVTRKNGTMKFSSDGEVGGATSPSAGIIYMPNGFLDTSSGAKFDVKQIIVRSMKMSSTGKMRVGCTVASPGC